MPGTAPAASSARSGGAPGVARADPGAGGPRRGPRVVAPAVAAPGVSSAERDDAGAVRGRTWPACTRSPPPLPRPPVLPRRPCHSVHYPPLSIGRLLLAVAVVAPLLLAARYPLLGWRIGWLALLLAPLVPGQWRGGWPWGPAQLLVLLAVFCVAGVRYRRPVLWWMWALSLIPWWLWLATDLTDLNGPLSATIVFTAATIAVDSISSRLAHPAGPGRPDRAHRAGAGAAGRAGGAHPDRAGTARRGRPSHVADRGAGRDRAVPPQRPARISPRRVRLAERSGTRGAGGDAAAARRAAPRPARRARAAAPAIGPARARRCRPASRGIGRAVRALRRWTRCLPASRCARTGSCRNRCPTPASTPPEPRSPCRWTMTPARSCCGWPTDPAGPPARQERARARSRADRDARAGGAARRLAVGRPGARRRLRGLRGAPARRDGMTARRRGRRRRDHAVPDRRRPGDGAGGLRRGTRRPAGPAGGGPGR